MHFFTLLVAVVIVSIHFQTLLFALPYNKYSKVYDLNTKDPTHSESRSIDSQSVKVSVATSEETPQLFSTDLELKLDFLKVSERFPNRTRDFQPGIAARSLENSEPNLIPTFQGPTGPKNMMTSQIQATQAIDSFCSDAVNWHRLIVSALWWRPKSTFLSGSRALIVGNLGKFDVVNGGKSRMLLGAYFNPRGCSTVDAFEFEPGTDQEPKEQCTYRFDTILIGCDSETPISNKTGGTLHDGCRVHRMALIENRVNNVFAN